MLAAGRGSRLRPLTDAIPKPLLPVTGEPLLGHTLRRLAAAGCEAAAVNLHHHGDEIRRRFGDHFAGLPLTWSEEPRLLGTLGALLPLLDFLAGADLVLIVNGDSLCRWPLAELVRRHQASGALATLLLAARADPAAFGGGVAVGAAGAIRSLRPGAAGPAGPRGPSGRGGDIGEHRRVFAGAHVLSPELLRRIPAAAASAAADPADIVRDLYEPLLAERPGCIASLTTTRRWHDVGTPRRYLAATLDWAGAGGGGGRGDRGGPRSARGGGSSHAGPPSGAGSGRWISPAAEVARSASVRRSSIEAGCRIGEEASLEDCVLLPGAGVGGGAELRNSILGPGAELLVVAGGMGADADVLNSLRI